MKKETPKKWIALDVSEPIWSRFFTVAPLVVIGSREGDRYDLAPKHMVTPLGHDNYFGFVCTPEHATYHNVKKEKAFTVSFVTPKQVVLASLAATPREADAPGHKPIVEELPTLPAQKIDGIFIRDAYLLLECELDRVVDGFGANSLIAGKIVAARLHQDSFRASETDDAEMIRQAPLLAYLAYGRFAEIRKTMAFPFPRGFEQKVLVKE